MTLGDRLECLKSYLRSGLADGLSGTGLIGRAAERRRRAGILGKSYACGLGQSGSKFTEWRLCIMGFVGFRDGQGEGAHSLAGDMGWA